MNDSYIMIFFDWPETTSALNAEEKGRLMDALVVYARGDEGWQGMLTGNERFVFPMFRAQLDRNRAARAEKLSLDRENGKKGGRPKKNPPVISETRGFEKNPPVILETQGFEKNPPVFSETQNNNNNQDEYEDDYEYDPVYPEEEDEHNDHTQQGAGVAAAWRRCFGKGPNPTVVRTVERWARIFHLGDDLVREAISAAAAREANDPVSYVIALFRDWDARGIRSAEELE